MQQPWLLLRFAMCASRAHAGLDYLSSPSSVIKAAQDLAAAAFNAQQTWFLVNGCSVGIHAAVMATVQPGETLLLARNCHLSAYAACVLSDAVPLWLQPEQDSLHGVAHCISPEQLRQGFEVAKQQQRKVAAVLVVSPTYYGAVARIAGEDHGVRHLHMQVALSSCMCLIAAFWHAVC